MTVKIKTSVINSVNIDGAKVNVSLNQDGVSFSMPYETDEIKLKEKLKFVPQKLLLTEKVFEICSRVV